VSGDLINNILGARNLVLSRAGARTTSTLHEEGLTPAQRDLDLRLPDAMVEVFKRTALRGLGTVGVCLETFGSDDEKGVNLANLIVASEKASAVIPHVIVDFSTTRLMVYDAAQPESGRFRVLHTAVHVAKRYPHVASTSE
jgi:hypothetical protein